MPSAPIAIPSRSPSSSAAVDSYASRASSTSVSPGRYVPLHKRTPSSTSSTPEAVTYSRDALLALAPPTSWSLPESLSSSPEHFHHLQQPQQQHESHHQGWSHAHEAMRNYLRVVCPEIVLNRKMRKSLQWNQQQHQQSRNLVSSKHPQQHVQARPVSPASSSSSSPEERRSKPQAPVPQQPQQQPASRPSTPSAFKRATPRRTRPAARTNTRTARLNGGFTVFHKQLQSAAATEADWRRGAGAVVAAAH